MRLGGKGLPMMNNKGQGDLYVTINIKMPANITPEQEKLIKKLSKTGL